MRYLYPHYLRTRYLKKKLETKDREVLREQTAEQTMILKEVASNRSDTRMIVGHFAEPREASRVI